MNTKATIKQTGFYNRHCDKRLALLKKGDSVIHCVDNKYWATERNSGKTVLVIIADDQVLILPQNGNK